MKKLNKISLSDFITKGRKAVNQAYDMLGLYGEHSQSLSHGNHLPWLMNIGMNVIEGAEEESDYEAICGRAGNLLQLDCVDYGKVISAMDALAVWYLDMNGDAQSVEKKVMNKIREVRDTLAALSAFADDVISVVMDAQAASKKGKGPSLKTVLVRDVDPVKPVGCYAPRKSLEELADNLYRLMTKAMKKAKALKKEARETRAKAIARARVCAKKASKKTARKSARR